MILTPEQPTLALHARNAAESAHPELWRGLVGAWVPALGYQGSASRDIAKHRKVSLSDQTWKNTIKGRAIDFNGSSSYAEIANADDIPDGQSGDTLTLRVIARARVGPTDNTYTLVSYEDGGDSDGWFVRFEFFGTLATGFTFRTLGVNNGGTALKPVRGVWYDVVWVWQVGDGITTYVDGKQIDFEAVTDTSTVPSGRPLYIGAREKTGGGSPDDTFFDGQIAQVCVWNKALHPSAIRTLHTDPLAAFRLRDDTALATAAMFGGTTTPSVTIPPPLLNMQMTGSF